MNCVDPQHVDVELLTANDFYATSGRVCKTCHKRRSVAFNRQVAERMRAGRPVVSHSRRPEEKPEEEALKLKQLEKFYSAAEASYQVERSEPQLNNLRDQDVFGSQSDLYKFGSVFIRSGSSSGRAWEVK